MAPLDDESQEPRHREVREKDKPKERERKHSRTEEGAKEEKKEHREREKQVRDADRGNGEASEGVRDRHRARDSMREQEGDVHRDREKRREKDRSKDKGKEKDRARDRHDSTRSKDVEKNRRDKDRDQAKEDSRPRRDREKDRASKEHRRTRDRGDEAEEPVAGVKVDLSPERDAMDVDGSALPPPPPLAADASAADEPSASILPAGLVPQVQDSGGEVSMSVEETNRVRIALGLKPLTTVSTEQERQAKEVAADRARKAEVEKKAKAEELAEKVKASRQKRKLQADLDTVTKLSAPDESEDNLLAWVNKTRQQEEAQRAAERAAQRAQAARTAKLFEEDEEEDEDGEGISAAELAGLKVKHGAAELGDGETVILTLADRNILDERGDLDEAQDELENVRLAEEKARAKARKEATKQAKPLFGEDGEERGILDKYDEAEDDAGMVIDAKGLASGRASKQQDSRPGAETANVGVRAEFGAVADYYTAQEMATFSKPKKVRKKKKLRKREADEDDEEAGPSLDIAALEAEAAARAANGGGDHGSRARGDAVAERAAASAAAEQARLKERYERAKEKATWASRVLKQENEPESTAGAEAGAPAAEDEELYETLARARRTAAARSNRPEAATLESVALRIARKRREEEEKETASGDEGMEFTEASEFVRGIELRDQGPEEAAAAAPAEEAENHMEVDLPEPSVKDEELPEEAAPTARSGWVSADAEMKEETAAVRPAPRRREEVSTEGAVTGEVAVGKGLAGALGLLKERGELMQGHKIEWAGRTNDMKKSNIMGLEDVYKNGAHATKVEAAVERALTRMDEYGRVMTPKEAFRQLSYRFHGKAPSKNKQEKAQRKAAEEMAAKKSATSEAVKGSSLQRLSAIQQKSATPYMALTGTIKPGQTADPASGYSTVDRHVSLTPVLGGGQTPLVGDRKVEAMLGIKRPSGTMPPPAPKRPKQH